MHSEIAFILDRSGSMQSMTQAAIDGFNDLLRQQQAARESIRLTLVLFDHEIQTVHDAVPVAEICSLDAETYVPRGSTALLDAIGDTIDRLGRRFASLPDDQKPAHVSVAILTDGEENASRHYGWNDVSDRIRHQTEKYAWEFLFLGAGQDAIATAARMNIDRCNASNFTHDAVGLGAVSEAMARKVEAMRRRKLGIASAEEHRLFSRPMDDIVREEDEKRRGK